MTIPTTIDAILDEQAALRSKTEDAEARQSVEGHRAPARKQVARPKARAA